MKVTLIPDRCIACGLCQTYSELFDYHDSGIVKFTEDLQQRRPPPAADAGRSCWGSGQQDMSAAQGAKWPLGAATRVPLEYHISRTNTTPRLPAGRGVRLVYRNFSCYT